ncbi:adenosylcobinamide-GDP ribazoletransferase [Paenibacillus arenilitoris]|uniref:Adenosylcobinamide-GDP ribazoletransferase n=1 Tax=Paenibacillus arenilitoris TaxID=2772299 RepID=A0A927H809_9BACL|nr:adenosylcobinamide-GDP ribazoletransferase [Paenibacillus arenilitoris]MBD2871188.1 adenosylcobinamide-GDP ribazoletransferase [Paenibacillus arenilitoris]
MVRHAIKRHAHACIAAFQFLTRLPIPVEVPFVNRVLTRSVIYFPLAGAFIGACVAAAAWLLGLVVPAWPSAVILLALWTALSGGLHLDGWMDTADGVLSHRSRERMLEIMKDSRVGAMGVLAAVLLLLFKASLLAELLREERGALVAAMLIAGPAWGRAWMAAAIAAWPNARKGEGIGAMFEGVKFAQAAAAFAISLGVTWIALAIAGLDWPHATAAACGALALTLLAGGLPAAWLNRKLGGLTGDTYGAMNETVEAVLLFTAMLFVRAL